jgi:hypothetical protein
MSGDGASSTHAADPDRPAECAVCAEMWPCQTVCWERMQKVVDLHQRVEISYGEDADDGCCICGPLLEYPCPTVAALTVANGDEVVS